MNWFHENSIYKYKWGDRAILYSPIGRCYLLTTEEQIQAFEQDGVYGETFQKLADYVPLASQKKVRKPEDYTLLTVLPNSVCNFSCTYCYSAKGRNGSHLDIEKLCAAINFFIDSKPADFKKVLTISFMGGGEPLLSWECVKQGIEYAYSKAAEKGVRLKFKIITNGSVLTEDMIDFVKKYNVEFSVSFEIIPEIQNLQRKHYEQVYANIAKMLQSGITVQVNSTITQANVERMEEMIYMLVENFSSVKNIMFEPVVSEELFETPSHLRLFYEQYVNHFCSSLSLADKYGMSLTSFAYLRTIYPLERACPGEFCITADGDISGCYCVSTDREPLFPLMKYGVVKDRQVCFDTDSYYNLLRHNVYSKQECMDCCVKWNCGGGCLHQFGSYTPEYQKEVCLFTRLFVENIVKYKVKKFLCLQKSDDCRELPIFLKEM